LGDIGGQQRPLTEVELELDRVKRELTQVKQERDILKKAAAYFEVSFLAYLPGSRCPVRGDQRSSIRVPTPSALPNSGGFVKSRKKGAELFF
ncbi:MAG: hypothetical protein OEY01_16600, partial [Desulfobulbaceae bacterium]|nr:hypothetical protein [Desulfobulbaceae bacterium]